MRPPNHVLGARLLRLMRLLESTRVGWTYERLAERLGGVSVRTVRRDVETLCHVGAHIPITHVDDDETKPALVHRLTWPSDEPRSAS